MTLTPVPASSNPHHIVSQLDCPQHLARNTQSNLVTPVSHSYTLLAAPASSLQAYPLHWHSNTTHAASLRSRCKALARKALLKEFVPPSLRSQFEQPSNSKPDARPFQPPTMRMKDSDDYLTVRAANPRTGLVSPSLACTPCTPKSPAEALALHRADLASPTARKHHTDLPGTADRPPLSHAIEGRKVSLNNADTWRADRRGCFSRSPTPAFPRPNDTSARAALRCHEQENHDVGGDRFILPMPSAREPQPYAYPGRSAEEISAYEYYRRKARKTSGEGWDQRHLQAVGVSKSSGGRAGDTCAGLERDKTVVRQRLHSLEGVEADLQHQGTFASYASLNAQPASDTSVGPGAEPVASMSAASLSPVCQVPRLPVSRKPLKPSSSRPITHLSQLPKVRLVHPELASQPMPRLRMSSRASQKNPSLGFSQNPETGICAQRTPLDVPHSESNTSLFSHPPKIPIAEQAPHIDFLTLLSQLYAHLKPALVAIIVHIHQVTALVQLPHPILIDTLTSSRASPRQKLQAVRSIAALAGQTIAVLLLVSTAWKLAAAVVGILNLLTWPLIVPIRIARWIVMGT